MEKIITEYPEMFSAVVIAILTFVSIMICNRVFRMIYKRKNRLHLKFMNSVINVVISVVGAYACLTQFEVTKEVSTTLLRSGTLIVAVLTFAAQKALANVIAGFSISASRPCDIGQKVRILSGSSVIAEGLVTDMTIRHIVIEQYDGQSCIVPNSVVDEAVIVNTNYSSPYGNILEVDVAYDTDIDRAKEIIVATCMEEPLLIKKDTLKVTVSRLTSNGLVLKFTVWTKELDESFTASSNLRQHVVEALRANHITIPYNTVTIDRGSETV
ncbi:MAG: mechanosensitive ion channel family protein [Lachnospiraceae bacterium]|nr:mechanosensitive ion channel family protein [Lachnospiraceae bacterium]